MKNSKVFHNSLDYYCGKGKLKLNIYNGNYIYNFPLFSIGLNSYELNTSIVYNSSYKSSDFNNKLIGFGNGWKLNIEERLFEYDNDFNLTGFDYNDYVYIDSLWNIHRFINYRSENIQNNNIDFYYDESGTGLILEIIESNGLFTYTIRDELNNEYIFENERLVEVRSCINSNIKKKIIYQNNKIIKLYDDRKNNRYIEFDYSGNYLIGIANTLNNEIININYDSSKIINISHEYDNTIKLEHEFLYNNNLIEFFISTVNLETIKLEYDSFNNVRNIKIGALKEEDVLEEIDSEIYCGECNFVNENIYLTNKGYIKTGENYVMPLKYIKECYEFTFMTSKTSIKNKKDIVLEYHFDIDGKLLCCLENKNGEYFSLGQPKGIKISQNGNSNIIFDGNNLYSFDNDLGNSIFEIGNATFNNSNPLDSFISEENNYYDYHILSFYIFSPNCTLIDKVINVSFQTNYGFELANEKQILNNTSNGVFQKVTIPFFLEGNGNNLGKIVFTVNDLNNILYITDIRIFDGDSNKLYIDNIVTNTVKQIKIGDNIKLDNENFQISPGFYLSYNDIISTFKSIYLNSLQNISKFDFYCNNKTKIYYIEHAYYVLNNTNEIEFCLSNNNVPNFHFTKYTLYKIKMMRFNLCEMYLQTDVQFKFYNSYYEIETLTGEVSSMFLDNRMIKELANIERSYKYMNFDGTERGTKIEKIIDNINVNTITRNYYDIYGNLTLTKTFDEDNEYGENLSIIYGYSSDKELLLSKTENGETINYFYDNNLRIEYVISNNLKKVLNYDDYNNISRIDFIDTSTNIINSTNYVKYDKHENICLSSDSSGNSIGYLYNCFGDICRLTINNKLSQTSMKDDIQNKEYINVYQKDNELIRYEIETDNYGNLLSEKFGEDCITYTNDFKDLLNNNCFSEYLNRCVEISDPYEEKNITIDYNDKNGNIVKTIFKGNNEMYIVENSSLGSIANIINDNCIYKYEVTQIENGLLGFINCKNSKKDNNDNSFQNIPDFSLTYKFDNLNRINEIEYDNIVTNQYTISLSNIITYKTNTNLPIIMCYNLSSNINGSSNTACINYYNEYMGTKITKFTESGYRFINNPVSNNSLYLAQLERREVHYSYDNFDRLISENDGFNNIEYYYNNINMLDRVTLNNNTIKRFNYTKSKLTSYTYIENNNDIVYNINYDNYDNIISIGNDIRYHYNERNLLKQVNKGTDVITFLYNYEGLRTKKKVNNLIKKYYYDNTKIIGEDWIENDVIVHKLRYFYDLKGICGIYYDNCYFRLIKDSLGNVSKVMYQGKIIGEYIYDAWGNVRVNELSIDSDPINGVRDRFILNNNPFRYKGYYYDVETSLYYITSRYYDPEIGRFISLDSVDYLDPTTINGLNLYAYCGNDPINNKQRHISYVNSVIDSPIPCGLNSEIYSLGSYDFNRANWENDGFQTPIWISSLISGSDFGASIAPALRTIYQYIRYPGVKDLNKLYGLDFVPGKLNTVCSAIGYGLLGINIGLSAWSNFSNDKLTVNQQWISFGVDTAYTLGTFGIGSAAGALVSLIPGVGVFIAPFAAAGVTWLIEWTNDKWRWLDDVKQGINDL